MPKRYSEKAAIVETCQDQIDNKDNKKRMGNLPQ